MRHYAIDNNAIIALAGFRKELLDDQLWTSDEAALVQTIAQILKTSKDFAMIPFAYTPDGKPVVIVDKAATSVAALLKRLAQGDTILSIASDDTGMHSLLYALSLGDPLEKSTGALAEYLGDMKLLLDSGTSRAAARSAIATQLDNIDAQVTIYNAKVAVDQKSIGSINEIVQAIDQYCVDATPGVSAMQGSYHLASSGSTGVTFGYGGGCQWTATLRVSAVSFSIDADHHVTASNANAVMVEQSACANLGTRTETFSPTGSSLSGSTVAVSYSGLASNVPQSTAALTCNLTSGGCVGSMAISRTDGGPALSWHVNVPVTLNRY